MDDKDTPISRASLVRQIEREGKRWGLVPHDDPDMPIGVADMLHAAEVRAGLGEVTKAPRRLRTVDDEHPFSAVLQNRVHNGETDLARPYKERRRLEKMEHEARMRELYDEARAMWADRRRIVAGAGGISSAGLKSKSRGR